MTEQDSDFERDAAKMLASRIAEVHDSSELWAHIRRDPEAFINAALSVVKDIQKLEHDRCGAEVVMLRNATQRLQAAIKVVNEQAEDAGLWTTNLDGTLLITEAYLQQELRRLHGAIEGKSLEECVEDLMAKTEM